MWLTQEYYSKIKLDKKKPNEDKMRQKHSKLAQIRDTKQRKPSEAGEIGKVLGRAKMKVRASIFRRNFISHLAFFALLLNFAYSVQNNSFHYNPHILN